MTLSWLGPGRNRGSSPRFRIWARMPSVPNSAMLSVGIGLRRPWTKRLLEFARIQPARVANSDAKALTRYLGALGLEIGPDRLNDLLVLLSVIMVEVGGGLSLAIV